MGMILTLIVIITIIIVVFQYVDIIVDITDKDTTKAKVRRYCFPVIGVLIYLYDKYQELD